MTEQVFATAHKLSEVIKDMQKCLQCTICLHTITDPVKTLCGHRFCRPCIQTVLQKKNASCPLCNLGIQRRSISTDEDMRIYIERMERLIEAIQTDSGIDLSCHLEKSRATKENCTTNTTAYSHHLEEYNRPSYSKANLTPKKRPAPRSYLNAQKQKKLSKDSKNKRDSGNSDILKYLTKCSLSGVELLPVDPVTDYQDDPEDNIKMNTKVHNWLSALPDTEALDDPDKITPEQPTECNLDDTLTVSVSQNCKDNKLDDYEAEDEQQRRTLGLSNEGRGLSETRSGSSKTELLSDRDDPKPSTSRMVKSIEDKERSQERSIDVQRTSPCDLLPSMKRNWSSVVRFGKEMRTKRKKLKSLNVSKCRSHDETGEEGKLKWAKDEGRRKESNVSSGVCKAAKDASGIKDVCARRESAENREDKDPEAAANIARVARNLDESLSKVEERRGNVENRFEDPEIDDRSNVEEMSAQRLESSDEIQIIGESSFIALDEGERVRIRNLNSDQMNNIIGVASNDDEDRLSRQIRNDQPENALPLKKRRNLSNTPPYDRSRPPAQTTPTKLPADKPPWETVNESTSKCQSAISQTSIRGRLSLTRRGTDPKSNDSSSSNCTARLSAARRDLNRQIDETFHASNVVRDDRAVILTGSKDERTGTTKTDNKSTVTFKKLGKVFKIRKKRVRFLYLGSTRRKVSMSSGYPGSKLEKPCNLVDYLDSQCFQNFNTFGKNLHITVNDSVPLTGDKPGEMLAQTESSTKDVSKQGIKRVDTDEQTNPKEPVPATVDAIRAPECSLDVVFVSVDEKDQKTQQDEPDPVESASNTVTKDSVKLMSPANDSQLKYLTLESPTTANVARTSRIDQQVDADKSDIRKKDSFFEMREARSRTLVRKSRESSGSSDPESTGRLTGKNPGGSNDEERKTRTSTDEDSDHSFSSKATCIRGSNKRARNKDKPSTRCVDTVSLSSNSDIVNHAENRPEKQKKTYRRIVSLISSDTDSPNLVCQNNSQGFNESPSIKRKRTSSPDSDCEIELKSLVKGWYDDLDVSSRCKKTKLNQLASSSSKTSNDKGFDATLGPNAMVKVHGSQPKHLSEFATKLAAEQWDKMVPMDQDSPDFTATIDKIQHIRNSASATGGAVKETTVLENLNDLNFESNAFDDYFEIQEVKPVSSGSSLLNKSVRSSTKDVMLAHRSNSSDKENKYDDKRMLCASDSDDDVTMLPDRSNLANKRSEKSQERYKPLESTDEQSKRNGETDNEKRGDVLRVNDDLVTKDTDFEQDSLMNVTQHYLLIKQFEEDLFGKPLCSNNSFELRGQEQKTPQKMKNKDTEHSAEEDDIVENTPDTKTKNLQLNNLIREGSVASPISRINENHLPRTPSSVTERSTMASTPCSKKSLHPLYQSTPKVQQSSSRNKCASAMKPPTTNASIRRTKSMATTMDNPSKQRLCFVCSGLLVAQVDQVKRLARMMNASYLTQFEERVTHVIVKVDEESNGASKTLKYLQGIAHRKWIVGYQWVIDSLKEKKLANEERYEAVDCSTLEAGPRNSRLREKNLFEGFVFLCIGPYVDVSVEQYRDLLRATGATVVDSLEALTVEKRKLKIIVIQSDVHDYEIIEWYQKARAVPIVHDWVVECISQYKLISFYPYLQELSRQDVLALGYPDFLVEEEPEGDSDSACNTTT